MGIDPVNTAKAVNQLKLQSEARPVKQKGMKKGAKSQPL